MGITLPVWYSKGRYLYLIRTTRYDIALTYCSTVNVKTGYI